MTLIIYIALGIILGVTVLTIGWYLFVGLLILLTFILGSFISVIKDFWNTEHHLQFWIVLTLIILTIYFSSI